MEAENFARPGVDQRQVSFSCGRSCAGKVSALGTKPSERAVQVFISVFLPFAIPIRKTDAAMRPHFHPTPVDKPRSKAANRSRLCAGILLIA